jgi:hypothetical protein
MHSHAPAGSDDGHNDCVIGAAAPPLLPLWRFGFAPP